MRRTLTAAVAVALFTVAGAVAPATYYDIKPVKNTATYHDIRPVTGPATVHDI